ncbi:MAG: hypothetical protein AB202_00925 [Parcubacteria bacterium C7867-007]|nr:MAG: hypothetical protein AB202_00925 [Parcubacteria bacterium C7867-007]
MVRLIVWVVVGLLALSFFGVSLRSLVESPTNQENISFVSQLLKQGWGSISMWVHAVIDPIMSFIRLPF